MQLSPPQEVPEESIPLTSTRGVEEDEMIGRSVKGKERALVDEESAPLKRREEGQMEERIFDVGDSDDEDFKPRV